MHPLKRLAIVVALIAFPVLSGGGASAYTTNAWEKTVAIQVNHSDRIPRDLVGTHTDYQTSWYAHMHSVAMAQHGYLYHSTNLPRYVPSGWRAIGENVGVGPDLGAINTALMNSAPHRANILCGCYTHFGTGVVRDSHGYYWVTQIFYG